MLRGLAESFVVSPPSGVTIKTRLRPTPAEEQALREVGTFLGSLYRADLVTRLSQGKLDAHGRAQSRKVRKKYLTAQSSSRWAGSITRATQDQYDLAVRALAAERAMLVAATGKLSARVAAPAGGRAGKIAGYRSAGERHGKTRRLAQLTSRLGVVDTTLASGRPSVVPGGRRLWRNRNNLAQAHLSVQAWETLWTHQRMFLSADGESRKRFGNETIRVDHTGHLSVKVPGALVGKLGARLSLAVPVVFHHKQQVWADRVAANRCVTYRISFDPDRGRWYLQASWAVAKPEHVPTLVQLARSGPVLGVDLNEGHLAAWVVDPSGNPVGEPLTVPLVVTGLPQADRGRPGQGRHHHADPYRAGTRVRRAGHREPQLRRRQSHRPRDHGPGPAREEVPRHRGRPADRAVPGPAGRDGLPGVAVGYCGRPGVHVPVGRPALAAAPSTEPAANPAGPPSFRSVRVRPSCCRGRDRQKSPHATGEA